MFILLPEGYFIEWLSSPPCALRCTARENKRVSAKMRETKSFTAKNSDGDADAAPLQSSEETFRGKSSNGMAGMPSKKSIVGGYRGSCASDQGVMQKPKEEKMKATFVDANAMKEKVRQNLTKPQYSVKDYYKTSGLWVAISTNPYFEHATLSVIAFNALWIAVDTDLNNSEVLVEAHPLFIMAENFFCGYFFFEWAVRFMSFRRKRDGLRDPWFVFDSFMVTMMVLETWVMTFVLIVMGGGGSGAGDASILRVARLLRLSRMARMARLLRSLPELMIMIRGMVAASRSVFFTLLLLILVLYVFAIAFTQLCSESNIGQKYFNTVPDSMFTLLIYGTLLDNIGALARELGSHQLYIAALFFIFVLIAALTVMNMLIGVLCEVVNAVAATEKEEMLVTYVNQKLQRVVSLLDADGGGTISKKEFLQILENTDAVRCLQDVGVDVIGLVDYADTIFEDDTIGCGDDDDIDEEDREAVELDFGRFMDVVLQLRGSNNATVKDMVDLRKFVRTAFVDVHKQLASMNSFNKQMQIFFQDQASTTGGSGAWSTISSHATGKSIKLASQKNGFDKPVQSQYVDSSLLRAGSTYEEQGQRDVSQFVCTGVETIDNEPVHIQRFSDRSSAKPFATENSSPPGDLQPSIPVHFLRPVIEEPIEPDSEAHHSSGNSVPENGCRAWTSTGPNATAISMSQPQLDPPTSSLPNDGLPNGSLSSGGLPRPSPLLEGLGESKISSHTL